MKLSEIIKYLQSELDRVGDREVYTNDDECDAHVKARVHGYKVTNIEVWEGHEYEVKEGDFYILNI